MGKLVYGLIFNDGADGIWLGKYENGTVRDFARLSDFEDIYDDLPLEKFAFVEVEENNIGQIIVQDISTFEICKRSKIEPITKMLEDLRFPSCDSDVVFRTLLKESGKMN